MIRLSAFPLTGGNGTADRARRAAHPAGRSSRGPCQPVVRSPNCARRASRARRKSSRSRPRRISCFWDGAGSERRKTRWRLLMPDTRSLACLLASVRAFVCAPGKRASERAPKLNQRRALIRLVFSVISCIIFMLSVSQSGNLPELVRPPLRGETSYKCTCVCVLIRELRLELTTRRRGWPAALNLRTGQVLTDYMNKPALVSHTLPRVTADLVSRRSSPLV